MINIYLFNFNIKMISQFFVISLRGDTIIHKDCKIKELLMILVRMDLDVGKYTTTQDIFLSKVGINNSYSEDK